MPSIANAVDLVRTRTFHSGFHGCFGSAGRGGYTMLVSGPYAIMVSMPMPPIWPLPELAKMPFGTVQLVALLGSRTFCFSHLSM